MKHILLSIILAFTFLGCSSKSDETTQNVEQKLVVGNSLADMKLKDQHEKTTTIPEDTKVIFFSFSKPTGHACNAFLESKQADYLAKHKAVYVADVSAAPGIIKSMFILPDLKELKFPILLINDDKLSAEYQKGMDTQSIVVVELENMQIKAIKKAKDEKELEKLLN
jgi:hypothetical protein